MPPPSPHLATSDSRNGVSQVCTKRFQVSSPWVRIGVGGGGVGGMDTDGHTGWTDSQRDRRGKKGLFREVEWILAQRHARAVSQSSSRNFYPRLRSQQPNDSNRLHTPLLSASESNCGAEADSAVKPEQSPDPTYHTASRSKKKKKKEY